MHTEVRTQNISVLHVAVLEVPSSLEAEKVAKIKLEPVLRAAVHSRWVSFITKYYALQRRIRLLSIRQI
jgi:hypothetical protein